MPFKSDKQKRWMYANKPEMAKRWVKEMLNGGALSGASHRQGGIPIEAEGGEYIIRKDSVNSETEKVLDYINKNGRLPISDAKNRRE